MANEKYTLNDGTVINDEVADKILEDVYKAVDNKSYQVMTSRFRKKPQISVPNKELRLKLLQAVQYA
jgi:hypothetical protein